MTDDIPDRALDLADADELAEHHFTGPLQPVKAPSFARRAVARAASGKVWFRNIGWTCTCVAKSLPLVEDEMLARGLISDSIDIYQLGYRNDVAASAGTHGGGGNTDVGQFSDAQIAVWRAHRWTIQHRTRAQGFDMDHGHGWPLGCTHLSSGGLAQAWQWLNNRTNGLAGYGPIIGAYFTETWSAAYNRRKGIVMALADDIAEKVAAKLGRQGGGGATASQIVNFNGVNTADPGKRPNLWSIGHVLSWLLRNQKSLSAKLDTVLAEVKKK